MMVSLSSVLIILLVLNVVSGFINTGEPRYVVTLDIYSGRRNPSWTIDRGHPLYFRIGNVLNRGPPTALPEILGYRGFAVTATNAFGQRAQKTVGVGSGPALETLLVNSAPIDLGLKLRQHVFQTIKGWRPRYASITYKLKKPYHSPKKLYKFCKYPRFDPENWNFPPVQWKNNCYNYATQRQTHHFSQPGVAGGQKYTGFTAPEVLEATFRDGLVYLPIYAPIFFPQFCYIALVIWPGEDYHFYRLDNNFMWSHKPGSTPAINVDNKGELIHDPRTADRGHYIVFAGFLGNHPGVLVE